MNAVTQNLNDFTALGENVSRRYNFQFDVKSHWPVAMNMTGAVGVAEVDEGGVDEHVLLALLQQVFQVAEVAEAATHSIPGM